MAAGAYRFVLDCIVTSPVDVTFELMHRRGTSNVVLATWSKHFDPLASGDYDAQPYEVSKNATAVDYEEGDLLVFRYSANSASKVEAWIPNGDGELANGRIPHIALP